MSWRNLEPIEGVLTEILELLEVKGVEVEELHSFDLEKVTTLWPIYGVILFYSCKPMKKHDIEYPITNLFFARQAHKNSCATQALLLIVMNCPEVDIGPKLAALKESAKDLSPDLKGQAILNDEAVRSAHNEFAPEDQTASEEEDIGVYHFVSYLPVDGILYELDGLEKGPISLGDFGEFDEFGPEKGWLELLLPLIEERVDHYVGRDIKYRLMAVIKNKLDSHLADRKEVDKEEEGLKQRIKEVDDKISVVKKLVEEAVLSYSQTPTTTAKVRMWSCRAELQGVQAEKEALKQSYEKVNLRIDDVVIGVIDEVNKHDRRKKRNSYRKHGVAIDTDEETDVDEDCYYYE